jgi:DNA-binding transcriptional ArsR family regulator
VNELIWPALAEPNRRRILDVLRVQPCAVGELARYVGLGQPQTSKHLGVLRAAGLVTVHPDAQRRVYQSRPSALAEIDSWLAPYRKLWTTSLDALEMHLDQNPLLPGEEPK